MCSAQEHSFSEADCSLPGSTSSLDSSSSARVRPILRFCLQKDAPTHTFTTQILDILPTRKPRYKKWWLDGTWSRPGSCEGLVGERPVKPECSVCRVPLVLTPVSSSLWGDQREHDPKCILYYIFTVLWCWSLRLNTNRHRSENKGLQSWQIQDIQADIKTINIFLI